MAPEGQDNKKTKEKKTSTHKDGALWAKKALKKNQGPQKRSTRLKSFVELTKGIELILTTKHCTQPQ